ncbi:MAG: protein kinase [Acidobacteriota bacterium]|nr:protein kinase [Acidobacteriota bacterium]
MTPERWGEIDRLFHAALEREPAERLGFLVRECADDATLRREVETLLASYVQAGDFIEAPASDVAAALLEEDRPGLVVGPMVGPFKVDEMLAAGGMGEVYLAEDTRLGRKVALKLLPPQFTADPDPVRRFEQEARAASALNHPNIVTIHEIGQADSLHYIATEFVEGETLREHMRNTRMTVGQVLDVTVQVASALSAAHEAGIIHRDIKPENIMLRRDRIVKVLDFGLAKLLPQQALTRDPRAPTKSTVKTNPGVVMGTVGYMSPEQARGLGVDARTDIFSLGVVLFEMVSGRAPFGGETPSHVIVSILESEPPPLPGEAEVPTELERIISKALRKDKEERYQTASDLGLDLKNLREELTVESRQKRFHRSEADGGEGAIREEGGLNTARASATSTAGITMAHLISSAQYVANGIERHRAGTVFASVAAFLLLASTVFFSDSPKRGSEAIDSVAVLSFVGEGSDPDAEYLADGISDGVISSLSRLPDLRVISLSTALRYKGRQVDPQQVGRELNVRAVLMGRLARRGDLLAISAELVDARDNRRLWGGQYNRKPSELLPLQDEIAREIAGQLTQRLGGTEKQRLSKHHTGSAEAYDAYLRGRFLLEKRTRPAINKSIEYLERATELDPEYALAYATLSYAYWSHPIPVAEATREESLHKAKAAATKALEIDGTLAEAHTALGHVKQSEGDFAGAESSFKRGIELNPNSGFVHSNYSLYLRDMGRIDEAVAESKRAVELEPASVLYNRNLARSLYFARRYDEAIGRCQKTLELDPNMSSAYRWLAKSYEQKKLYAQAAEAFLKTGEFGPEVEAEFREAYAKAGWKGFWQKSLDLKKARAKQREISLDALAETYVRLGEKDQAFAVLERGNKPLNADPFWDALRSDPRYADLVRRMGLEP